jgi:flagellar hook protein FlgE
VQAPTSALPPRATTVASIVANLDSAAQVPTTATSATFDLTDPANTSNFSDTLTVYDSLGQAHTLDVYFRKTAVGGPWEWHALVSGDEIAGGAAGTNVEVGTGVLTFGTDGTLQDAPLTAPAVTPATPPTPAGNVALANVAADFLGATPGQGIVINFGTSTTAGGTGQDGVTQYASASNVSSHSQDGYTAGDFSGIAIDGQGVVMGLYTNGQKLAVSQLSIAKFRSNDGLGRAGQGLWIDTRESGPAAFGVAGSGGRGAASSGALEMSNVDLAEEFVGLIQHQRSFSANSKTITTADEMLQELIGLKR